MPGLRASLVPVVRVAGEDGLGAVQLLGQERAGQQVQPGHGAQGVQQRKSEMDAPWASALLAASRTESGLRMN